MPLPLTLAHTGAAELLQGYRFTPPDLAVASRRPGLSAFMRIRNGADFLEATICSHLHLYDEVVAVFNQCTDRTEDILLALRQRYPEKLRVIHYLDRVYPPGSQGHAAEPGDSPHSMVNYTNAAICATRYSVITKLDDDHLAMRHACDRLVNQLRSRLDLVSAMHCFSGLNLWRTPDGALRIAAQPPISGNGDIGYFPVRPDTYYVHDRRFERFQRGRLQRQFDGFMYWHLKYLKTGGGYANYELALNPDSRHAKRLARASQSAEPSISLSTLKARVGHPGWTQRLSALLSEKHRLLLDRNNALAAAFPYPDVEQALSGTVEPKFLTMARL